MNFVNPDNSASIIGPGHEASAECDRQVLTTLRNTPLPSCVIRMVAPGGGSGRVINLSLDGRLSLLCKRRTDEHQQRANGRARRRMVTLGADDRGLRNEKL
jgi:hypothetical protein